MILAVLSSSNLSTSDSQCDFALFRTIVYRYEIRVNATQRQSFDQFQFPRFKFFSQLFESIKNFTSLSLAHVFA